MSVHSKYVENPLNPRTKLEYLGTKYRFYVNNGLIIHDYQADPIVIKEIENLDKEFKELKELYKNEDFYVTQGRGIYSGYFVKAYKNKIKKPEIKENKKSYVIVYNNNV